MVEAIIDNVNHLSKFETFTIPVYVIKEPPQKPSNIKTYSKPIEIQSCAETPDNKKVL